MLLLQAMGHDEGYYARGLTPDRPQRNNNPGDLMYGAEAIAFGANAHDAGYAIFPTIAIGWKAFQRWLSVPAKIVNGNLVSGYLGATLKQVIYRFAPPSANNSVAYLAYVIAQTGLTANTIITEELLAIPS